MILARETLGLRRPSFSLGLSFTHIGILSSNNSTSSCRSRFTVVGMLPYQTTILLPNQISAGSKRSISFARPLGLAHFDVTFARRNLVGERGRVRSFGDRLEPRYIFRAGSLDQ